MMFRYGFSYTPENVKNFMDDVIRQEHDILCNIPIRVMMGFKGSITGCPVDVGLDTIYYYIQIVAKQDGMSFVLDSEEFKSCRELICNLKKCHDQKIGPSSSITFIDEIDILSEAPTTSCEFDYQYYPVFNFHRYSEDFIIENPLDFPKPVQTVWTYFLEDNKGEEIMQDENGCEIIKKLRLEDINTD